MHCVNLIICYNILIRGSLDNYTAMLWREMSLRKETYNDESNKSGTISLNALSKACKRENVLSAFMDRNELCFAEVNDEAVVSESSSKRNSIFQLGAGMQLYWAFLSAQELLLTIGQRLDNWSIFLIINCASRFLVKLAGKRNFVGKARGMKVRRFSNPSPFFHMSFLENLRSTFLAYTPVVLGETSCKQEHKWRCSLQEKP